MTTETSDPQSEDPFATSRRVLEQAAKHPASIETAADTNALVVGLSPALSIDQTMFSQSAAQSVLFGNMVAESQRQNMANATAILKMAKKFYED